MNKEIRHQIVLFAAQKYVESNMPDYNNKPDSTINLAKDMAQQFEKVNAALKAIYSEKTK